MAKGKQLVPGCHKALDALKYEIAAELGLPVGKQGLSAFGANEEFATELGGIPVSSVKEDYWGHIASRDTGAVGGAITSRLIRQAEETLFSIPNMNS